MKTSSEAAVRWSAAVPILVVLVGIVCASSSLRGQDADTIVLRNDDRKFTIVSQIEDPKEAADFLAVLRATEPISRYQLANSFLKAYPQSWLLPQAFDVAARSAIDLAKYEDALTDGRFSLRLIPENPSLLILLANVEAQEGQFDRAIADADDALEYLDQIERPSSMTQTEWNAIRPQLKASAYFARARVEASRALSGRVPADSATFRNALADLNIAAAWNPEDTELFYLRAIVEVRLQNKMAAASDLAFVFQSANPLQEKAKQILLALSRQLAPEGTSLEAFIRNLPAKTIDASLRHETQRQSYPEVLADGYAGSNACQGCHAEQYATWRKTGMARMFQPYRRENVLGDFSPGTHYSESAGKGTEPDVIRIGFEGRPYFELLSLGTWQRFYVDFTIGSKWQQGYATKLPDGRLQVIPIEYNLLQKKWINYWKMIDPPGSPRAVIPDFPKFTVATNYQQNCAICHTSQLKSDRVSADPMEHAVYLQPGIDCEMCHGPSAWHIKQVTKQPIGSRAQGGDTSDPLRPPLDFRKADNRASVRVCAQCHRQSAVREIGDGGEMNYSVKGSFIPATWLRSYDAFSRKAFYKDGRFKQTTFIVEAFTRSACYLRGTAQCASCHSPHVNNVESNLTSLKFQDTPNEMCLSCHSQYRSKIAEHSHHAPNTEASLCVSCHMPRILNALLFTARSHQIEIPTADLTERFGQQDSPNVCLTCHSQKPVRWAKEQLASWRH